MNWNHYHRSDWGNEGGGGGKRSRSDEVSMAYVETIERKIDSLALACQSLWEILRDHTDLTEEELASKMEEIDLRDGTRDGKITPVAQECPSCGRKTSKRRDNCLYCGAPTPGSTEIFARTEPPNLKNKLKNPKDF